MITNIARIFVFSLIFWVQFSGFAQEPPSKRQFEKKQDQFMKVVIVDDKEIPQKRIPSYFFPPAKTFFDQDAQVAILKLQMILDSIFIDYTQHKEASKFLTQLKERLFFDKHTDKLIKHLLVYNLAVNIEPYQDELDIYVNYFRSKELAQLKQEQAVLRTTHLQIYKRYLASTTNDYDTVSYELDKIEEYAYEFRDSTTLRETLLDRWSHNHKNRYRVRRLFERILPTLKDNEVRMAQQAHEQRIAVWQSGEQKNSVLPALHSSENDSKSNSHSSRKNHHMPLEKSLAEKEQLRRQRSRSKSRNH